MILDEIKSRVDAIRESASDYEIAHIMEDTLYSDFITFVAAYDDEMLRAMALEVLKTEDIEFDRYCA